MGGLYSEHEDLLQNGMKKFYCTNGFTIAGMTYANGLVEDGGLWQEILLGACGGEYECGRVPAFPLLGHIRIPQLQVEIMYQLWYTMCVPGILITAQVYNSLGSPVGSPVTYISDGQTWDLLDIPAPSPAGAYYIHVGVFGYSSVLGYSVF